MSADRPEPVSADELDRLVQGRHRDPHSVLGAHPHAGRVTIRTLRPDADGVTAVAGPTRVPLLNERAGVWAGVWPYPEIPDYRLDVTASGTTSRVDDPYRFAPSIGELDQHLIGEGRHEQLWEVLGAHVRTYRSLVAPVVGTSFAVWAPNARGVRVVGDFNNWDGTGHAMRSIGATGVWELFVPEVGDGTKYKFHILGADGVWRMKIDPLAFATEVPPATASVVFTPRHRWNDAAWLERRRRTDWLAAPVSIYELHLGSWRQGRSYRQLAEELVGYVRRMGFTHVEFLPVAEHPFGGSWGYQISAFYAPTARFGSPDDFRHLVDRLHQAGIGVIVDWVPAHFPKDEWALGRFDGTPLYEHPDPRQGEHPDWGTYVFDYGRHEVRNFLVANARFWFEEFHVDGLRVDAVASMLYLDYSRSEGQWVPNRYGGHEHLEAISFLQETNAVVHDKVPRVLTIAEESTAWPGVTSPTSLGGLGFDLKWDMGWMHDTLGYLSQPPIHRQYHHQEMTFSMVYAYSENFVLPLSHDEVVHGKGSLLAKMPGDRWQQLANLRALLAYMWAHPGKQLLFMGSELAQEREWSESRSLDWKLLDAADHRGVWQLVRDLNRLYGQLTALHTQDTSPPGFAWIDANDAASNVFSFLRLAADGSTLVCLANFAGVPHEGHRVGLPSGGTWREVLNTDAEAYGGSGVGNLGQVEAVAQPAQGQPASVTLRLPPLGVLWLVPGADANDPGRADRHRRPSPPERGG